MAMSPLTIASTAASKRPDRRRVIFHRLCVRDELISRAEVVRARDDPARVACLVIGRERIVPPGLRPLAADDAAVIAEERVQRCNIPRNDCLLGGPPHG